MAINREPQVFLFLSKILGRNIIGATGEALGRVYDLTAEFVEPYPIVTGIIFSSAQKKNPVFLPWENVIDMDQTISVSVKSTTELSSLNLR